MLRKDPPPGKPALSWSVALVLVALVFAVAGTLVSVAAAGPTPPFLQGATDETLPVQPPTFEDDAIHLAGSGSNLPVTRALARAFEARGGQPVVVHASIGSGGGIRAVRDGAIAIGLISRPLSPAEKALGLHATPYARTPISVVAHPTVPIDDVTHQELVALYRGQRQRWNDRTPVVVLQRERGDSSHTIVAQRWPDFARANEEAYDRGRWRVLHHDAGLRAAVTNTPGAIGLFAEGVVPDDADFRALSLDGVAPTLQNLEGGDYPFAKKLSFVTMGPPRGPPAAFILFARSEKGQAVIRAHGYAPWEGEDPI